MTEICEAYKINDITTMLKSIKKYRGGVLAERQFRIIGLVLHSLTFFLGFYNYFLNLGYSKISIFFVWSSYFYDCLICLFGYSSMPLWTSREVYLHHLPIVVGVPYIYFNDYMFLYYRALPALGVSSINEMIHYIITFSPNFKLTFFIKNIISLIWFSFFALIVAYELHFSNINYLFYIYSNANFMENNVYNNDVIDNGNNNYYFIENNIYDIIIPTFINLANLNIILLNWPFWYQAAIKNIFKVKLLNVILFYRLIHLYALFFAIYTCFMTF